MELQVTLTPTTWNPEAAGALAGAVSPSPTYGMADLEREVMDGTATLYTVALNGRKLGFVVLWFDSFGGTRELVIQSGAAIAHSDEAIAVTLPALERFAKAAGCVSMRAHSNDTYLIRQLVRYGFKKTEIVLQRVF